MAVAESSWGGAGFADPAACEDPDEHNGSGPQAKAEPARGGRQGIFIHKVGLQHHA